MNCGPRSNALDNLLAKVAALAEVEGALLICLLGKMALQNINAIERHRLEYAQGLGCIQPAEICSKKRRLVEQRIQFLDRQPDGVVRNNHPIGPDYRKNTACGELLLARHGQAKTFQRLSRVRPNKTKSCHRRVRLLERDIVHDDEPVKVLKDVPDL